MHKLILIIVIGSLDDPALQVPGIISGRRRSDLLTYHTYQLRYRFIIQQSGSYCIDIHSTTTPDRFC